MWPEKPVLPKGANLLIRPITHPATGLRFSARVLGAQRRPARGPHLRPVKVIAPPWPPWLMGPSFCFQSPSALLPSLPKPLPPGSQKPASPPLLLTICAPLGGYLCPLRLRDGAMGSLTISQAGEQLSSHIHLFATRGDVLGNCQCVQSHRLTVPGPGAASPPSQVGCSSPGALVSFPVGVSLAQPYFQRCAVFVFRSGLFSLRWDWCWAATAFRG